MNKDLVEKYKKEGKCVCALYDRVFKEVITDPNCKNYVSTLISGITKIPKEEIKEKMTIKNSELLSNKIREKWKITDILIEVGNRIMNLEMYKKYYKGIIEKNIAYANKITVEALNVGEDYIEIKKSNSNNIYKF